MSDKKGNAEEDVVIDLEIDEAELDKVSQSEEDAPKDTQNEEENLPPTTRASTGNLDNNEDTINEVVDEIEELQVNQPVVEYEGSDSEPDEADLSREVGKVKPKQNQHSAMSAFLAEEDLTDLSDDEDFRPALVRQGEAEVIVHHAEPTPEIIEKYVQKKHVRNSEGKKFKFFKTRISPTLFKRKKVEIKEIVKLGPGIMGYFFFLKLFAFLFLLFTVLSFPSMFLNYVSSNELEGFMRLSLGNLFQSEDILNELEDIYQINFFSLDLTVNRVAVHYVVVLSDVLIIIMFLIAAEYSIQLFKRQQYKWEKETPTIETFTLEVTNLPRETTYKEIKEFFEDFVETQIIQPEREKELELEKELQGSHEDLDLEGNDEDDKYKVKEHVHDVQLITTTKAKLTFAIKAADLARGAEHMTAKYAIAQKKRDAGKMSQARFQLVLLDYKRSVQKVNDFWTSNAKLHETSSTDLNECIKAYITFNTLSIKDKVLKGFNRKLKVNFLYNKIKGIKDEELYFKNRKLRVRQANSPELLKWENVDYKSNSRKTRAGVSCCTISLILFFSALSIFLLTKAEDANFLDDFDESQQAAIELIGCDELEANFRNSTGNDDPDASILNITDCEQFNDFSELDDVCAVAFNCFCTDINNAQEAADVAICQQLLFGNLIDTALLVATGFLITLFNFVLQIMISSSVSFEKDVDRSAGERKLFTRLFVATYLNTAVVKLVADLDFPSLTGFSLTQIFSNPFNIIDTIEGGEFEDFTFDWYAQVGTDIVFIGITNIFGPHIYAVFSYFYFYFNQLCFRPISLQDIKKRYLGPEFLLPTRFAQAMVIIYFTMTYSAGIPLLYPICCASLIAAFYVDKFLLLKFYRTPPLYTNSIVIRICKGMKIGIILHNIFAIVMFSEPGLFPVTTGNGNFDVISQLDDNVDLNVTDDLALFARVTSTPVIFLTLILFLMIIYLILSQFEVVFNFFLKVFAKLTIWTLRVLTFILRIGTKCLWKLRKKCKKKKHDLDENKEDKEDIKETRDLVKEFQQMNSLSDERRQIFFEREKLLGLRSYNILANPQYARKLKLKGNKSYSALLQNSDKDLEIHTTTDVIALLENGQEFEKAKRFIFSRTESAPEISDAGGRPKIKTLVRKATRTTLSKSKSRDEGKLTRKGTTLFRKKHKIKKTSTLDEMALSGDKPSKKNKKLKRTQSSGADADIDGEVEAQEVE